MACSNGSSKPSGSGNDASASGDGAASADAGEAGVDGAPSDAAADGQAVKRWDWTGVIGTGQSLSVGALGTPVKGTKQTYNNLKLALNGAMIPPFDPTIGGLTMVPLTEPIRPLASTYPSAYPANMYGESPHTAMSNQITALFQQATGNDYVTVHTVVGESGQGLNIIDKAATEVDDGGGGTSMGRAYPATLFEARAIMRLAGMANKTYGIGAIVITHGETDAGNSQYEQGLVKLWSDYNADLSMITGQTTSIPMFVSQQNALPMTMGSTSASTLAQWKIGVDHAGDILCSGPKYQYPYAPDPSANPLPGLHLTAQGYELLGEKFGEIFYQKVVMGQNWQPLQPSMVSRAGSVVTVQFHVPVGPLTWDDTFPSPHPTAYPQWTNGRGFEVMVDGAPATITSVAIAGDAMDTVQITCGADLTGHTVSVAYAYTADGTMMPGGTWRWGHLRDSDPFVGATTQVAQPNYAVAFSMSVP